MNEKRPTPEWVWFALWAVAAIAGGLGGFAGSPPGDELKYLAGGACVGLVAPAVAVFILWVSSEF